MSRSQNPEPPRPRPPFPPVLNHSPQMLLRRKYPNAHTLLPRFHLSSSADAISSKPGDLWIAKAISTAFLLSPPSTAAARLAAFREVLSPSTVSEAIHRLRDPKLSLDLFELTRSSFHLVHLVTMHRYIIGILCESGLRDAALKVFDEMIVDGHTPDGSVLGVLVNSYTWAGELDAATSLLSRCPEYKCRVSAYIFNNLMRELITRKGIQHGVQFFCKQLSSVSFTPDTCSFNIIIKGLCRLGDTDRAFEFFNDMGRFQCFPNTITHNILIDGFCRTNQVARGREILQGNQMNRLCSPSVVTYTSMISGYCRMGEMQEANDIFSEMINFGVKPNKVTYNVLIDGYGKAGDMASAVSLYEKMIDCGCYPDIVTFTSLIDGYCRNGKVDDAMKLWQEMREKNIWPNAYTFSVVINAFCKQNRLTEARNLLMELRGRRDIVVRPFMYNPVIDGFCRVGNVDEANLIHAEMEDGGCFPDKVTYTILIIGHCVKGRMSEAIFLFHKMIMTGCAPDTVTIGSLITCLLSAGMPGEAKKIAVACCFTEGSRMSSKNRYLIGE